MSPQAFWFLHHPKSGRRHGGLTLDEARAFLMALKVEDWDEWEVWCQGWSSWHTASEVGELKQGVQREISGPLPPATGTSSGVEEDTLTRQMRKVLTSHRHRRDKAPGGESPEELDAATDVEIEDSSVGREFMARAHPRYKRKMRVEIECNGQKFITHSVDVSVGGVMLEDALPEWVFGYCTVDLVNEETQEVAELTCSVVENQDPNKRIRLEFLPLGDKDAESQLDDWLQAA